jgi:hypothetical protein
MLTAAVDPMLEPWRAAGLGDPYLVRTVDLQPSYWLVPVVSNSRVLGYVEVAADGRVLGHAYLYRSVENLDACPSVVTRLTASEASREAAPILGGYAGAQLTDPVFIHDGPRNKLAWMVEVWVEDELISRVFITPGYVYEHKGGEARPPPGTRGW